MKLLFHTPWPQRIQIPGIAWRMVQFGFEKSFTFKICKLAFHDQGVMELMLIWDHSADSIKIDMIKDFNDALKDYQVGNK